jgi:hypothetical protein
MTLKEILHLLTDGISLAGPIRQDVHDAIEALEDLFGGGPAQPVTPAAALSATVTAGLPAQANLSWTAPAVTFTGYVITRTNPDGTTAAVKVPAFMTSYIDQGLEAGAYSYTVDAVDVTTKQVMAASTPQTVSVTAYVPVPVPVAGPVAPVPPAVPVPPLA